MCLFRKFVFLLGVKRILSEVVYNFSKVSPTTSVLFKEYPWKFSLNFISLRRGRFAWLVGSLGFHGSTPCRSKETVHWSIVFIWLLLAIASCGCSARIATESGRRGKVLKAVLLEARKTLVWVKKRSTERLRCSK